MLGGRLSLTRMPQKNGTLALFLKDIHFILTEKAWRDEEIRETTLHGKACPPPHIRVIRMDVDFDFDPTKSFNMEQVNFQEDGWSPYIAFYMVKCLFWGGKALSCTHAHNPGLSDYRNASIPSLRITRICLSRSISSWQEIRSICAFSPLRVISFYIFVALHAYVTLEFPILRL